MYKCLGAKVINTYLFRKIEHLISLMPSSTTLDRYINWVASSSSKLCVSIPLLDITMSWIFSGWTFWAVYIILRDLRHADIKQLFTSVGNNFQTWLLFARWRHQMETFSMLLALCAGNSPVTCEFPSQRPVTWSFDVFFDLHMDKWLSKQSRSC